MSSRESEGMKQFVHCDGREIELIRIQALDCLSKVPVFCVVECQSTAPPGEVGSVRCLATVRDCVAPLTTSVPVETTKATAAQCASKISASDVDQILVGSDAQIRLRGRVASARVGEVCGPAVAGVRNNCIQ